jgi:GNAT superfamily N-acetyltransferase
MIPFEVIALSPYAREMLEELSQRRGITRVRDSANRLIEIDHYRADDWSAVLEMYSAIPSTRQLPLNPEQRAVAVDRLLSRGPGVVARCDGRVVGHAVLATEDDEGAAGRVVFVPPDYRDAGIEKALGDALLRVARKDGRAASDMAKMAAGGMARLRALGDAARYMMIPLICALVIAVVSEDPRGRWLALILAAAFIVFGIAVYFREIVFGRRTTMATGEWQGASR